MDSRSRRRPYRGRLDCVETDDFWDPRCSPPRGLVRPVPVDPTGATGPTKRQAAGPRWRRTSRGAYVPAEVDGTVPEQRILEQAHRLPPGAAVTGWAALRLHGARYFEGTAPDRSALRVPVVLGPGERLDSDDEIRVSREPWDPQQVWVRAGIRVTEPRRALFDELRRIQDWRSRVVAMDMTAAAGLVSIAQMVAWHAAHSGWRRARRVPRPLRYASERSRSPAEPRMRLVWEVDARLPRPLVNQEIFDRRGRFVAMVDLLDPVAGVVGEYDGAAHRHTTRRGRDIGREELLRRLGLEYFDAVAPDLRAREALADRMRSTRARARFESPDERAWTIDPPPGWPREPSLDERLFHLEMARQGA